MRSTTRLEYPHSLSYQGQGFHQVGAQYVGGPGIEYAGMGIADYVGGDHRRLGVLHYPRERPGSGHPDGFVKFFDGDFFGELHYQVHYRAIGDRHPHRHPV